VPLIFSKAGCRKVFGMDPKLREPFEQLLTDRETTRKLRGGTILLPNDVTVVFSSLTRKCRSNAKVEVALLDDFCIDPTSLWIPYLRIATVGKDEFGAVIQAMKIVL
jgi:hypothetical protein